MYKLVKKIHFVEIPQVKWLLCEICMRTPYKSNAKKSQTPYVVLSGKQLNIFLRENLREAFPCNCIARQKSAEFLRLW
jgi:hypothetical protein